MVRMEELFVCKEHLTGAAEGIKLGSGRGVFASHQVRDSVRGCPARTGGKRGKFPSLSEGSPSRGFLHLEERVGPSSRKG